MPPPAPSPTPTPTPPPSSSAVAIFRQSGRSDLCVGGSVGIRGDSGTEPIGQVIRGDGDRPHIRYTSGGYYEIELPGKTWDRLIPHSGISPPSTTEFQPRSSDLEAYCHHLGTRRRRGYQYIQNSNYDGRNPGANRYGAVAFGAATLPGRCRRHGSRRPTAKSSAAHPTSSTPTRSMVQYRVHVSGTVDFGVALCGHSRSGRQPRPQRLQPGDDRHGSTSRTPSFRSEARPIPESSPLRRRGRNYFLGQFTGPNAQEAIGAWSAALHFCHRKQHSVTADHAAHQAFGAWIPGRVRSGRSGGIRTPGPRFWRPMLYQLSYTPIVWRGSQRAGVAQGHLTIGSPIQVPSAPVKTRCVAAR